jgi:hypothetical protein
MFPVTVKFGNVAYDGSDYGVEYRTATGIRQDLIHPETTDVLLAEKARDGQNTYRNVRVPVEKLGELIAKATPDENGHRVVNLTQAYLEANELLSPPPEPINVKAELGKLVKWALRL